jgi:hypothetical protein
MLAEGRIMYTLPDSAKKIRERAMRYRRSLINEEKNRGYINDGAGKRYLVGPLFVLAGYLQKKKTAGSLINSSPYVNN